MMGKPSMVSRLHVQDISVNDVLSSIFTLSFPPGTMVDDRIREKVYYIPEGIENLDRAISGGRILKTGESLIDPPSRGEMRINHHRSAVVWYLLILNISLLFVVLLLFVFKRRFLGSRGG